MKKLFIYLFLLVSLHGTTQNSDIDQLNSELQVAKNDSVKLKIYFKKALKISDSDPQRALVFYNEGLVIAKKINDTKRIANISYNIAACYSKIGYLFSDKGKTDSALNYHHRALDSAKVLKDKSLVSSYMGNLSSLYNNLGEYNKAVNFALSALKIDENNHDSLNMAYDYSSLAITYLSQKNFTLSIQNFLKSLALFKKQNDSAIIAVVYENISEAYSSTDSVDLQLHYSFLSLRIKEKMKDTISMANTFSNIASAFIKKKYYKSALEYYNKALVIHIKTDDKHFMADDYIGIAVVYNDLKEFDKALSNIDNGMLLAKEMGQTNLILFAYNLYSDIYFNMNNYKKALEYFKLHFKLNDSLYTINKSKQIAEMQTKYETEKKEKEIDELTYKSKELAQLNQIQQLKLSRNWYLILGLGSFALLIIIVAILLIGRNKLKASQAKMEVEQKLFRSQMNPHFIFNSLIAIQNYVYKHEPGEVAGYISSFAKLMRLILENSRNESVPIEKELTMLKYYLDLQRLRFPEKFDYEIEVDPNIDVESISIPPMLSQPFIENAIEHGIMNKTDGKGKINVKFAQKTNVIEMRISDNGVGRSFVTSKQKDEKHESLATIITNERLQILNKQSKAKFTLKIVDLKKDNGKAIGTEVIICMPEK